MAHWLHRLTVSKRAVGVYLSGSGDVWQLNRVTLVRQKNSLAVEHLASNAGSLEEVIASLPKGLPLYLAVDTKGVLHRFVAGVTPAEALSTAFPNLPAAEVLAQTHGLPQGVQLSVARQHILSPILEAFAAAKCFVYGLHLGPWFAHQLAGLAGFTHDHRVRIGTSVLRFDGAQWLGVEKSPQEGMALQWTLGDDVLEGDYLPAYVAALTYFTASPTPMQAAHDPVGPFRQEGMHHRLFRKLGVGALGVAFVLVLINALVFMQYNDRSQVLSVQYSAEASQIREYDELRREVEARQSFLSRLGWGAVPPLVFYSDQLGQSIPSDIRLTALNLHPLNHDELDRNRRMVFTPSFIQVEGVSNDQLALNRWIQHLEALAWVGRIRDVEYSQRRTAPGGAFSFNLPVVTP